LTCVFFCHNLLLKFFVFNIVLFVSGRCTIVPLYRCTINFLAMKTKLLLSFLLLTSYYLLSTAQIPQGFNYQAIARDGSGNPILNTPLPVTITIQSDSLGGTIFWKEAHSSIMTNGFGLFSLVIGKGTKHSDSEAATFSDIDWTITPKFIKTEIFYESELKNMGSSRLLTVPYSMVAGELGGSLDKLEVAGKTTSLEEALFEVKNKDGQTVFAVYNEGVRIYVDDAAKSPKGGFSIGGFGLEKGISQKYLFVSADSIRAYIGPKDGKASKGGFVIGGFDNTKQITNEEYLRVTRDSTRVYINDSPSKVKKGGFAIGGFDQTKDSGNDYLRITPDSTTISTSNQSKRVTIKNPSDSVPLLSIEGSIKMGYDSIATNGIMGYNGSKFLTYEKTDTAWKQFVVTGIPEVLTDSVFNITRNAVSISGNVIKDGGSEIVARGVCWSISPNPTLMDNSRISGNGKGHFFSDIAGLKGSSKYYLRTFATNSKFTNYGEEQTVNTLQPVLPSVSTLAITSITGTSATSGGNITDDGADNITVRGICWNTTGNPVITGDHTTDGTGNGTFTSSMTSLQVNRTYFVRAYATNSVGTVYGETFSFATTDLPVLSTNPITAVTGNSATTGGNIFAGGELSISGRGVCWNTTGNPTLEDSHTENGTGTGSFVSNIPGLSLGTTYFVRSFAVNSSGTAYGNEYFFTTLNFPTITTSAVSLVTGISATCGGIISYNGGAVVTTRGICWNTTGDPVISDSHIAIGDGTGTFSTGVTGLTIGTTYYVRAYATNSIGTAYGNPQSFTTQNYASVTTSAITSITYTTATGGGNITSDGGALITLRGICWNTTGTPVITDSHTSNGTGAGIYISNITGLAANNTYHVRAYAINSIGTTYGQEADFSTPTIVQPEPGLPVIGTISVSTGSTGYNTGGYISSDGGSAITQRGICWGISGNPTLADNYSNNGTGIGLFNSTIVIAGCGTTYYLRAYATNSTGTGYGNQFSVASGLLPFVETTAAITEITKTTAMSGGTITNDGGCTITERGICWNRYQNPTISNFKTASGSGTGTFTASMTGLYPNSTYYVRAYATNSLGTGYGPELNFTTQAGASGAAIGQFYAGGYVFYLDETGDHGLVSSQSDLGTLTWGCNGTSIPGLQTSVGTGATNTAIILANCASAGIAARVCDNLELNGYSDWFLPSRDELALIYNNLHLAGIGGFSNTVYWSSSEFFQFQDIYVWYVYFINGTMGSNSKLGSNRVRAARAF
jgi:hypothetical protein